MLDSFIRPRAGVRGLRALSVGAVIVAIAAVVGLVVANLAGAAKVVPELSPGSANKTCSEFDGTGQDWLELKVDPNADGVYTQGPLTVTVSNTQNDKTFDWTSNIGVDAVFVKAGEAGSYIYRYDPPGEETSDTGLTSPGSGSTNQISHIAFCYDLVSRIVVEKQTNPDGHTQSFDFTSDYDDGFALVDGEQEQSGILDQGTYSVSEDVPSGWALTSATCSDGSSPSAIALAAGEIVKCTFTNTKLAKIVVTKETVPDDHPEVFDFTGEIVDTLGDGDSESKFVPAGTYTVTESLDGLPVWKLIDIDCDDGDSSGNLGTLTATYNVGVGETVECTFTNEKRGLITIVKQTHPDGDPQAFAFQASYDGDGFSLADGEGNTSEPLVPGTYSVSEVVPDGWALTGATCSDGSSIGAIELSRNEHVTCTFTNTKQAQVVVKKIMVGGTGSFGFAGTPSGTISVDGGTLSEAVAPGNYSSSESVPAGWDLTDIDCDDADSSGNVGQAKADFAVAPGETVTCTFTNERKPGTIVIEKQTNPDGSQTQFPFEFDSDDAFSLADGEEDEFGDLDPGTYLVKELVPAGWELVDIDCGEADVEQTGSAAVEIDLHEDELVRCTFTNEADSRIIVRKETEPNGDPQQFEFDPEYGDDRPNFLLGDGQSNDSGALDPGQYSVGELVPGGWDLTDIDCGEGTEASSTTAFISLGAGQTVTCVFTNTKRPVGAINVIKTASPTTLKEPGGVVNFTVEIQNTSQTGVVITSVVDDRFGNLASVAGGSPVGCFALPLELAPGQSSTCTFPKEVTGTAGTSHVNVVTASGFDSSQNPVSDSDDATVTFTERLIDLVIVKDATSPTPLNGTVTYTMTVTNKGPDTATNVQLADPAPAGITYLSVNPGAPTCTVTASLLTCSLGTLAVGESRQVSLTARATLVGQHTNTATVTGSGGRETNPADNVDNAVTVVPAVVQPPTAKPKPKPKPEQQVCLTLTVTPRMVTADGRPDRLKVRVTAGQKRVKGTKVRVFGAGVKKTSRSKANGMATVVINPRRPGVITITAVERKQQQVCGPKRIGAVGVFLPPLTG